MRTANNITKLGGGPGRQKNAWLLHLFLLLASVLFLFPLVWLISTSLKPVEQAMAIPPTWIPKPFQWHNYVDAFMYHTDKATGEIPFLEYARNTIILAILTVSGAVCSNAMVAYAFARLRWKGRDVAFALTIATMMVPFPVTMGLRMDFPQLVNAGAIYGEGNIQVNVTTSKDATTKKFKENGSKN